MNLKLRIVLNQNNNTLVILIVSESQPFNYLESEHLYTSGQIDKTKKTTVSDSLF